MGGLGLDATGVFEVEANSSVRVGDGSGNITVGTITATTYEGLSSNAIEDSDTLISITDPAISIASDGADVLVIDRSETTESVFTGNISVSGSTTLGGFTANGEAVFGSIEGTNLRNRFVYSAYNDQMYQQIGDGTAGSGGTFNYSRYLESQPEHIAMSINTITLSSSFTGNVEIGTNSSNTFTVTGIFDLGAFS